jgi:hypothetical protein
MDRKKEKKCGKYQVPVPTTDRVIYKIKQTKGWIYSLSLNVTCVLRILKRVFLIVFLDKFFKYF